MSLAFVRRRGDDARRLDLAKFLRLNSDTDREISTARDRGRSDPMDEAKMATPKRNIIVIGASSGGVDALCELAIHLPAELDASLFVVLHLGATSALPQILSRCGNLPAVAAKPSSGRL